MSSARFATALITTFAALAGAVRADVWTVGAAGADFTDVQSAVDAAQDGDALIVQPGTYAGFTVDGKALSLVSTSIFQARIIGGVRVANLAAGASAALVGFEVYGAGSHALELDASAGSIRVNSSRFHGDFGTGGGASFDGAHIVDCDDVAFEGCTFDGAFAIAWPDRGGDGVFAARSRVGVYDSSCFGGRGVAGSQGGPSADGSDGGCGVASIDGTLFVSGLTATGGNGGLGGWGDCAGFVPGDGGDAGDGVRVSGSLAFGQTIGCLLQGGVGGPGGGGGITCGQSAGADGAPSAALQGATLQALPGTARRLSAPPLAHENTTVHLSLYGDPGDLAVLYVSAQPAWSTTPFTGPLLLHRPILVRIVAGTLFANAWLPYDLALPADLGPGVESITWQIQSLMRSATTNELYWSSAVPLVIVDSAF